MRHVVGNVEEFKPGTIKIVKVGARSIGVVNTGDGMYAVLNVCPHQLAPICEGTVSGTLMPSKPGELRYGMENRVIRCPWHGWEFDLTTGMPLFRQDKGRLLTFPVTVEGGSVQLEVKTSASQTVET